MRNRYRICQILALYLCISTQVNAQSDPKFEARISDVSLAFTNVMHGLPFMMIAPVHPGLEIGATILKKEKAKAFHSFSSTAGYYYHDILAHGIYANLNYNYQRRIQDIIGIDLHPGLGFIYQVYPGEGYRFSEDSGSYESTVNGKANLSINLGFGLSYTGHPKFQPFIHYDINLYNVWAYATFVNSTAILKAGVKINLDKVHTP